MGFSARPAALLLAVLLPLAACTREPPKPVEVGETVEATATVEAVDLANRLVTIRGPEGNVVTVEAGPEVRNLEQVKVGDRVVVSYYAALAAEFKKAGEGVKDVQQEIGVATAAPGTRPAGVVGSQVKATVIIESVDAKSNTVSFTGPYGKLRTVTVQSPDAQAFIKKLKKGDEVELTYTEAIAISVEPAE
jgi:ABC-type Fe3+-hydroxamate transport system substrate-binding protein